MDKPVIVADRDDLQDAVAATVRRAMLNEVSEAIREASLPEWLSREQAKQRYGLTDRQLTYLRQKRRVEYSQHGRRIFYRRASMDRYFEEGKVKALSDAGGTCEA
jgi:hypothetical protein